MLLKFVTDPEQKKNILLLQFHNAKKRHFSACQLKMKIDATMHFKQIRILN